MKNTKSPRLLTGFLILSMNLFSSLSHADDALCVQKGGSVERYAFESELVKLCKIGGSQIDTPSLNLFFKNLTLSRAIQVFMGLPFQDDSLLSYTKRGLCEFTHGNTVILSAVDSADTLLVCEFPDRSMIGIEELNNGLYTPKTEKLSVLLAGPYVESDSESEIESGNGNGNSDIREIGPLLFQARTKRMTHAKVADQVNRKRSFEKMAGEKVVWQDVKRLEETPNALQRDERLLRDVAEVLGSGDAVLESINELFPD